MQDFWRRWHMTLSSWLRDYLYIPIGGNRGGAFGTYRNIMITMALGGLWHGASFNFGFWGLLHGGPLLVELLLGITGGGGARRTPAALTCVNLFHFGSLSCVVFRQRT